MKLPLEGGCRCDRVRIRATSAPLLTMACHCNGCQRMSSSAFSVSAMFRADAFEVVRGEPVIGGVHGPDLDHFCCAYCMSWMFTRFAFAPHLVNVRPTMFEDHAWFVPYIDCHTKTKLPWAVTGAIQSFEEFPSREAYPDLMRAFSERQQ